MTEYGPSHFDQEPNPEHIPSAEEVQAKLTEIIGKEPAITRTVSDEQGLYLLEAEIPGELPGESTKYEYIRKGRGNHTEAGGTETRIHVTYYQDGDVVGGTSLAVLRDGKWVTHE